MSPETLAFAVPSREVTPVTASGLPSGSLSLASTWTLRVLPGRVVTSSSTATGLRAPSTRAAMPTRTVPVARAPSASTTAYVKVSVPAA